jgi:hypothetical protein
VLCQPSADERVTEALADYLTGHADTAACNALAWDLMELGGVNAHDRPTGRLVEHLAERGCVVHRRPAFNCWRIELPATWDQYLAMLSKGHRKQLRQFERDLLDSGHAVLHTVQCHSELAHAADLLVALHQRRRRTLGQRGCFASPRFAAFHREVMPRLLTDGRLQLHWLELDGKPAAVEYQLAGEGTVYAYQAGVEPELLDQEPGRLITLATLRRAIRQGDRAFDFLRGDEPYKAHFRAAPRPSLELRIVPNRASARLRHNLWLAGSSVKQWMKMGTRSFE